MSQDGPLNRPSRPSGCDEGIAAIVSGVYQPDWKYQRLRMALLAIADGRPMLEAQKLAIDALASVEEDLADAER